MENPEKDLFVLLGYLSDAVAAADDTRSFYDPKIGGRPRAIRCTSVRSVRYGIEVVAADIRSYRRLQFVIRSLFHEPAEFANLERVIYLFVCNKSDCSNSTGWFALRGQRPVSSEDTNAPPSTGPPAKPVAVVSAPAKPAAAALFSADWDDDPADSAPAPEPDLHALLRMRDLKLNPPAPTPAAVPAPAEVQTGDFEYVTGKDVFTAYYLEIAPEPAAIKQKEIKVSEVPVEPEEPGESYGEEGYEESENKALMKFQRRLERSPEQVVRYSWRGKPRWLSDTPPVTVPPCAACGAPRVFEFQMMPPLVYFLECAPDELDYGTAAVFVCSKSCGRTGNFVEFVAAQPF